MKTKPVTVVSSPAEYVEFELEHGPILPIGLVCKLTSLGTKRVYRWIGRGRLEWVSVLGQIFVPLSQVGTLSRINSDVESSQ